MTLKNPFQPKLFYYSISPFLLKLQYLILRCHLHLNLSEILCTSQLPPQSFSKSPSFPHSSVEAARDLTGCLSTSEAALNSNIYTIESVLMFMIKMWRKSGSLAEDKQKKQHIGNFCPLLGMSTVSGSLMAARWVTGTKQYWITLYVTWNRITSIQRLLKTCKHIYNELFLALPISPEFSKSGLTEISRSASCQIFYFSYLP